ncbi:MAG: hypothetical protein LBE58_15345, partial [Comamonas sp.]|nr:hypothetical protein [Comamonas sp.]
NKRESAGSMGPNTPAFKTSFTIEEVPLRHSRTPGKPKYQIDSYICKPNEHIAPILCSCSGCKTGQLGLPDA